MRKTLILATLAILAAATIPVAADNLERSRGQGAQANPISAEEMKARIDKLGYDVRHLKNDDGYFKTIIIDRNSGGVVRATFNAATGELVRASLASRG